MPRAKSLRLLTWWKFIEIACVLMGDVTSKVPPVPWVFPSPRTASVPAQARISRAEASDLCAFHLSCFKGILLIDFVSLTLNMWQEHSRYFTNIASFLFLPFLSQLELLLLWRGNMTTATLLKKKHLTGACLSWGVCCCEETPCPWQLL